MTRRLFSSLAMIAILVVFAITGTQAHAATQPAKVRKPNVYYMHNQHVFSAAAAGQTIPYNGGPVMEGGVSVFAIFWQPTGSTVDPRFNSLTKQFFNDFSKSSVFKVTKQYKDKAGKKPTSVKMGGSWVDTQPYPGSFISDAQLQAEVTHAMQVNHWQASLQHAFFVFPVKNEPICFDAQGTQCSGSDFCAYHDTFGNNVIYAAMPDLLCGTPTTPNNDPEAENVLDSGSHELMEAMTDPLLNAWTSDSLGEIGDPCSTSYPKPNPKFNNGDITGNGHFYMVQEEWSNARHGCAITFP